MVDTTREQQKRNHGSTPTCVIISDVHYNINTIVVADAAMRVAINAANALNVPFVVSGDLHDTKAILRGECVKSIIKTFKLCKTKSIVILGNHCLLSEKSKEHSLEFLKPYAEIVDSPVFDRRLDSWLIPYIGDPAELAATLSQVGPGARIIMHQGVMGAKMGHYVVDRTSLPKEAFKDFRVISGHYHEAQDIQCGPIGDNNVGLFSYVGNPYTLSFGEASHPRKGYAILHDDGSLERVPLNFRKHVVEEVNVDHWWEIGNKDPNDLLWLKVTGPKSELDKLNKNDVGKFLLGHSNFKLDLIPDASTPNFQEVKDLTDEELIDLAVDSSGETVETKAYLKSLWREIL